MAAEHYLAVDLGAGSGRVIVGRFDGQRVEIEEVHRFANPGVRTLDHLHWDVLNLFNEIKDGVRKAADRRPVSLGVDTWGVDYALLDSAGELIGNPYHYRDSRTDSMMERVFEIAPREEVFEHTGLQFMELNTLYQLYSMKGSPALDSARTLLMMPDLFHYWFTGEKSCEFTDASTTQFYDPRKKDWARGLLSKLGLPTDILLDVIQPGTKVGDVRADVAQECGVQGMSVVAPAGHDTGSAVAAVPAEGGNWAYLSSGTWSLIGVETPDPFVTDTALDRNYTNEGGAWGTTRLLKNVSGMWLLEECRREWARSGNNLAYDELIAQATAAPAFRSVIDVDDAGFTAPGGMPERIAKHCERRGEPRPETPGQYARAIFEGLAIRYRRSLGDLADITGSGVETLHIVGGGSRNELLSQYAADACGVPVVAGPVEATAVGSVLLQVEAAGRIKGKDELREVVRRSFQPKRYEPRSGDAWIEAASRIG